MLTEKEVVAFNNINIDNVNILLFLKKNLFIDGKKHYINPHEYVTLFNHCYSCKDIVGNFIEVGTYEGNSSKLISFVSNLANKNFITIDTFDGLSKLSRYDTTFFKHQFTSNYENIKNELNKYNITVIKGESPTIINDYNEPIAFVHLDVDIYDSCKNNILFFYNKISNGGKILIHDINATGIKMAIKEFQTENNIKLNIITDASYGIITKQ